MANMVITVTAVTAVTAIAAVTAVTTVTAITAVMAVAAVTPVAVGISVTDRGRPGGRRKDVPDLWQLHGLQALRRAFRPNGNSPTYLRSAFLGRASRIDGTLTRLQELQRFQRVQRLQQLQRLLRLPRLQRPQVLPRLHISPPLRFAP
jgi:hypothetical protein